MTTREAILEEIEAFLKRHDMAARPFGEAAVNDGGVVRRLRNGHDIVTSTVDRLREYMAVYEGNARRPVRRAKSGRRESIAA